MGKAGESWARTGHSLDVRPDPGDAFQSINFRKAFGAAALSLATVLPLRSIAHVVSLPSFNVDINQTSVSGLSAGGFMAVQFDVAYSSNLKGAGIIAGGPFYCGQGDLGTATTICSCTGLFPAFCSPVHGGTDIPTLIKITDQNVRNRIIDDTVNLANQKIFLFFGKIDSKVPQTIMNDLRTYYRHYTSQSNISYKKNLRAEHAMPKDFIENPARPHRLATLIAAAMTRLANC